jgi:hypothetical protein
MKNEQGKIKCFNPRPGAKEEYIAKPKRGGKRKGAGRKRRAAPLVALTLRLPPEVAAAWKARKAQSGVSGPVLLAHLLGLTPPPGPARIAKQAEGDAFSAQP